MLELILVDVPNEVVDVLLVVVEPPYGMMVLELVPVDVESEVEVDV